MFTNSDLIQASNITWNENDLTDYLEANPSDHIAPLVTKRITEAYANRLRPALGLDRICWKHFGE